MRQLIIDGTSLLHEWGVWIAGDNVFNGADANVDTVKVPGRNGDLVYSNKRYNNFQLIYPAAIPKRFSERYMDLRAFLYQDVGYRRIEDSYFPDMFRIGRISGPTNPSKIVWTGDVGLFSLTFDCKPQHFYKSGEQATTFTANGSITNPTLYTSMPMIRVYGFGTITVNGTPVTIAEHNYAYTDLDCEIQDAYNGDANLNRFVTVDGDAFPVLSPGTNNILIGSGITRAEVKPRWWTL